MLTEIAPFSRGGEFVGGVPAAGPRPTEAVITFEAPPEAPPAEDRFRERTRLLPAIGGLVARPDLVWALARRDFTARYKQTRLGIGWSILLPLGTAAVFAVFVSRYVHVNTGPAPYLVWVYVGLIPWNFFSTALTNGGLSLLSNQSLLNKVYSPRQIYPIASVLLAGMDAVLSTAVLALLFLITGFVPASTAYWLPVILSVQVLYVTAAALLTSIFMVYIRDFRNAIPIFLQLGLFVTPVVYEFRRVPRNYQALYSALNPVAAVIDSYRRTLLYDKAPQWHVLGVAALSTTLFLIIAAWVFARFERGIVDII
jgi:ABC-type polysaccharide/polyol phosphate export permease